MSLYLATAGEKVACDSQRPRRFTVKAELAAHEINKHFSFTFTTESEKQIAEIITDFYDKDYPQGVSSPII